MELGAFSTKQIFSVVHNSICAGGHGLLPMGMKGKIPPRQWKTCKWGLGAE